MSTDYDALVLVASGAEDIETVTILDVFRRAKLSVKIWAVSQQEGTAGRDTEHSTVALAQAVSLLLPADCWKPPAGCCYKAVVLPGGMRAAETFRDSPQVQSLLKQQHSAGRIVAAICASPIALRSIVGPGHKTKITCYPSLAEGLKDAFDVQPGAPVVVDGKENVVTGSGPGTAMEFALTLVSLITNDPSQSKKLASSLCYSPLGFD